MTCKINLVRIEIDPSSSVLVQQNTSQFDLFNRIEFLVGDARVVLEEMANLGDPPFDCIFIVAEKSQYSTYRDLSIQLFRKGTVIIPDNVVKHGLFVNETIQTSS